MRTLEIDDVKLMQVAADLFGLYTKETKGFSDDELAIVIVLFMEAVL